jgi:hypothetical protein
MRWSKGPDAAAKSAADFFRGHPGHATCTLRQRDGHYVAGHWLPAAEVILWGPYPSEREAEDAGQESTAS